MIRIFCNRLRKKIEPAQFEDFISINRNLFDLAFNTNIKAYKKLIKYVFFNKTIDEKINYTMELHADFLAIRSELEKNIDVIESSPIYSIPYVSYLRDLDSVYSLKMYESYVDDKIILAS